MHQTESMCQDIERGAWCKKTVQPAFMPSPDALLKFLNEFRTYAVTYARGPELATAYLNAHAAAGDAAGRWRAYVQLVTSPSQAFEK